MKATALRGSHTVTYYQVHTVMVKSLHTLIMGIDVMVMWGF